MSETMTERSANERWGEHPMEWPLPPHSRPRWWQFRTRRTLADLEAVFGHLDNAALRRWWVELRKGQSVYEDAGGYLLRCYEAMAGREVEEPYTYEDAATAIRKGLTP